ncbi:MAG: hypothetical protein ABIO84_08340 [Lysobacter sp.]
MGTTSIHRGLVLALLLTSITGLVACKPSVDAAVPEAGVPDTALDRELVDSLQGVWATDENNGDDAETVIMLSPDDGAGMQLVHDGVWWPGTVEDVDRDNRTVAMVTRHPYNPEETLTFRKIAAVAPHPEGSFSLSLTYGSGQTTPFGFVRRLTARDRADIARIVAEGVAQDARGDGPLQPDACDAATLPSLRATLVCNEQDFAELDVDMRKQFTELAERYPDGASTVASAEDQLNACASRRCLTDAYANWQSYFDQNYDLVDFEVR